MDPRIRITVDGKLALTVEQAAARVGVKPSTMRGELVRYKDVISAVAMLDGRKPVYLASQFDKWWKARPGKGAPGTPRRRKED